MCYAKFFLRRFSMIEMSKSPKTLISFPCKHCGALLPFDPTKHKMMCQYCQSTNHFEEALLTRVRDHLRNVQALESSASLATIQAEQQRKARNLPRILLLCVMGAIVLYGIGKLYAHVAESINAFFGPEAHTWILQPSKVLFALLFWLGYGAYYLFRRKQSKFRFSTYQISHAACPHCYALVPIAVGDIAILCPFCQAAITLTQTATERAEVFAKKIVFQKQKTLQKEKRETYRWQQKNRSFAAAWGVAGIGFLFSFAFSIKALESFKNLAFLGNIILPMNLLLAIGIGIGIYRFLQRKAKK